MLWYEKIHGFVHSLAPELRKTRAVNLVWLTTAVLQQRSLSLSALARALPGPQRHLYRIKRLWRFIDNPRVRPMAIWPQVMAWLTAPLLVKGMVPLIVDYTSIRDDYQTLWAAIPLRGRALPVASRAFRYHYPEITTSLNRWEEGFLKGLVSSLPQGMKPLFIADRGFGRSSLVAFLRGQGSQFVIRVNGKVRVEHRGRRLRLDELEPAKGQRRWLSPVNYLGNVRVNVAVAWGGKEPWYLVTTLGSWHEAVSWYKKRMWIEEMFRDFKWRLGMKDIRLTSPARVERLLLGLLLAYIFLTLLGKRVPPRWQRRMLSWGKGSIFFLGLVRILSPPHPPPRSAA